eukprot:656921-Rhodomonas_salina.1
MAPGAQPEGLKPCAHVSACAQGVQRPSTPAVWFGCSPWLPCAGWKWNPWAHSHRQLPVVEFVARTTAVLRGALQSEAGMPGGPGGRSLVHASAAVAPASLQSAPAGQRWGTAPAWQKKPVGQGAQGSPVARA